jgi:hypothetical protein
VDIIFGEPIDPKRFSNAADPYGALTEALKNEVKKLVD